MLGIDRRPLAPPPSMYPPSQPARLALADRRLRRFVVCSWQLDKTFILNFNKTTELKGKHKVLKQELQARTKAREGAEKVCA